MSQSENQPLIPPEARYNDPEDPPADDGELRSQSTLTRWRAKTAETLESPRLHKIVIGLITVDASCVLADLAFTLLSDTCVPVEGDGAPVWLNVLSAISLVITFLFTFEIPITLWAIGPVTYNPFGPVPHAGLHLFDAVVILTTFVLEVVLRGRERELVGLLILLRLWRLVKLVGGLAVGAGEIEEDVIKKLHEARAQLQDTQSALSTARQENEELKARLVSMQGSPQQYQRRGDL